MLALPLVDKQGPRAGYQAVDKTLIKHRIDLSLLRISVIGAKDALARAIRRALGAHRTKSGARLKRQFSAGVFIEDAYVYRSK